MPDDATPPQTPPPPSTPPPQQQMSPQEKDARMWNMLCHISALCGLTAIPFANVLGPLVIWLIKKNEIPSVDAHGKASVNFQLTVLIVAYSLGLIGAVTIHICIGVIFIIPALLAGLCGLIFAIIAGIQANDGKEYKYPFSFNLIK